MDSHESWHRSDETKVGNEKDAIALAISSIIKNYQVSEEKVNTLETKFDDDEEIGTLL